MREAVRSLQEAVVDEIQNFASLYNFIVSQSGPLKENAFARQLRDKTQQYLPRIQEALLSLS